MSLPPPPNVHPHHSPSYASHEAYVYATVQSKKRSSLAIITSYAKSKLNNYTIHKIHYKIILGTIYQFTLDTIYSAYENIKNTICCWWCKLVYSSLIFFISFHVFKYPLKIGKIQKQIIVSV